MIADLEPAPKPSLLKRRRKARIRSAIVTTALLAFVGAVLAFVLTRREVGWRRDAKIALPVCTVDGSIPARCGSLEVPEDRDHPNGRRISLKIVVIPSPSSPRTARSSTSREVPAARPPTTSWP